MGACCWGRPPTWHPSRSGACRQTSAATSGRLVVCSTRCCQASAHSGAMTSPRHSPRFFETSPTGTRFRRRSPRHCETFSRARWTRAVGTRLPDISAVRFLLNRAPLNAAAEQLSASEVRPVRRWLLAALVAAGVLLGAGIGGLATWVTRPATSQAPVIRLPLPLGPNVQFTGRALPVLGISADGARIAYIANRRLYVRGVGDPEARALTPDDPFVGGTVSHPVFSLDGERLAFFYGNFPGGGVIETIAFSGGVRSRVTQVVNLTGMTWGPDGILYAEQDNGISLIPEAGGKPELLIRAAPGEAFQRPSMLPGGETVLFTVATTVSPVGPTADDWRKSSIVAESRRSAQRKTLIEGAGHAQYVSSGHLIYAREGVVYGVRFEARTLTVEGKEAPVVEGVLRNFGTPSTGTAHLAVSETGTLLYVPGPTSFESQAQRLTIVGRDGRDSPLNLPPSAYVAPRLSPDGRRIAFSLERTKDTSVWIYDLSGTAGARQLSGRRDRYPLWSPTGNASRISRIEGAGAGIYWQRADGTTRAERLTKAESGVAHYRRAGRRTGGTSYSPARKEAQARCGRYRFRPGR